MLTLILLLGLDVPLVIRKFDELEDLLKFLHSLVTVRYNFSIGIAF